jgi:ABC-type lipoprotein release transport system permease subunit
MNFQLGWRNLWRNPKRTVVIMVAVIIGIWSMIFLGALMRGVSEQMVRNGIATLTGHIQIHHKDYRNDPVVENSIPDIDLMQRVLAKSLPAHAHWSPRVRVNAVASNARHSGGVTLVGIDPQKEAGVSFIGQAVADGRYLNADDHHGIIVGRALVEKFETKLGRKLVLMSQDVNQEIASRAFRIVGVFRAEMEATEKQFLFVTLPSVRQMLKLDKQISEISILLPDQTAVDGVAASIQRNLATDTYQVHTWQELLPMVSAILNMYDGFIFLWFLVVFIAMGFGIVNTTLMAVFERIREFGLLKALGMKPGWIIRMVLTESFYLLMLGSLFGNILGVVSIRALSVNGINLSKFASGLEFVGMTRIIYPALHRQDILAANLVVFFLGLLVSLYPAVKAARFTPVEAMAHT